MSLVTDAILEKINSLIVVVNQTGSVEYVSPSAKRILGFEPEHLMGNGWWDLTRGKNPQTSFVKQMILDQMKLESTLEIAPQERLLKTASGGDCWILWDISKGPLNTFVGIGHDITSRKTAEQKLVEKNTELLQHNKDMLDSIQYASRIQEAILPDIQKIKNSFRDAFVLYQPKDVVSGDYYFYYESGNKAIVAAVDCTGHGVPGALMSFIANAALKEVITKRGVEEPSEILYALDDELFLALNKTKHGEVNYDGMDVAIGVFDFAEETLSFAGAFRPAILVRDNQVIELEASRFPIGFYAGVEKKFETQKIQTKIGDTFYFFTDGYCDQFGGERNKKFTRKQFKDILVLIQDMEMIEQESYLQYVLLNWRQEEPQIDDVLVVGIKL